MPYITIIKDVKWVLYQQFQIQILTSGKGKQENQKTSKRET